MYVGTEELRTPTSKEEPGAEISGQKLADILGQHRKWVESHGQEGAEADLSHSDLGGADLTGVNLQGALLRKTNLKGADLLLADLQAACLMQADLQGANLLGTELREANLQGAILEGATGLLAGKLAGTNLFGAALPKPISEFSGLRFVCGTSKNALTLLVTLLLLSALTCSIIATTTDVELLKNSPCLPLPYIGDVMPMLGFYLFMPVVLLGFYLCFHFYLQRVWDGLAELPAIFPDGRPLDRTVSWLFMGLARSHFKWLRENRSAVCLVETRVAALLVYWIVPATLVLFWARYLTRQDLHGTMLHVLLVVAAVVAALFLPDLTERTLRVNSQEHPKKTARGARFYRRAAIPLGVGLILSLLSVGTIHGVPRDASRATQLKATDLRRWAAAALWVFGYNPYADLTEQDVSAKPKNWTGREEESALVKAVRLGRSSLRYAEAYRVFLVNAQLWQSDLEGASLSEADLRGANLRQANLRSAVLDRAILNGANLQEACLQEANLTRAGLREVDLSFASLVGAVLVDAKLEDANLYRANLHSARLLRSSLEKADLREANLEDANLNSANLGRADLWQAKLSGAWLQDAQLQQAILIEADLRGADLQGADLQGATWRGADLSGANLEGADLQEARGLNADQICSAKSRRGVRLDEGLLHQVDSQCGAIR